MNGPEFGIIDFKGITKKNQYRFKKVLVILKCVG